MEKITRKEREKQQRKAGIVDAGEKIFNKHGFEGASMDAIAKEAEFTKRTVYQYFPNKEDLFFAVVARSYSKLRRYLENAASGGKTGKEKLRLCLDGYRKFYNDDPGRFFLMNQVGYVRKSAEITENFMGWTDSVQSLFIQNEKYVSEGIEDGSLKNLTDRRLTGSVTTFMLTSLFNFFSQTGENFIGHLGVDKESFLDECLNVIGSYIEMS